MWAKCLFVSTNLLRLTFSNFLIFVLWLISRLKTDSQRQSLLSNLYDSWRELYFTKQTVLVEAVEQLLVNSEVKSKALQGLRLVERYKDESQKSHAILFVDDKLLALYSSRLSQSLSAADLLFITIFVNTVLKETQTPKTVCSHVLFLEGSSNSKESGCIPNIIHVSRVYENIILVLLIEHANLAISNNLFDIFFAVQKVKNVQSQGDIENMKQSYESMDLHVKYAQDALKKLKTSNTDLEELIKIFGVKWEVMKKSYSDYFKTKSRNSLLKIESNLPKINDALKELFNVSIFFPYFE